MRRITGSLTPRLAQWVGSRDPAGAEALSVCSFRELVEEVAQLSYLNKDHLLFYRGQARDYRNKAGASTVYPTIYRGERVPKEQLELSFDVLTSAGSHLCDAFQEEGIESHRDLRRRRYIRWSILQHYQVCSTPLLDLTHSLLVACSFAQLTAAKSEPCVLVFGLPYLGNRVSVNSEHDLVNVRLLSICPPEALRPYFQEGYLAGTDEITTEFDDKRELDFNNRLLAKFRLVGGRRFWSGGFQRLPEKVLYPPNDRVERICDALRADLDTGISEGRLGAFLKEWNALESLLLARARDAKPEQRVVGVRQALDLLRSTEMLDPELSKEVDDLRRLRNDVVHRPSEAEASEVLRATARLRELHAELRD